jgi:bifunctional pyridoxal-dependent enzyme with beta-cystathionase and maltose regulon repressor activities
LGIGMAGMGLLDDLKRLNEHLENGTYRAQWEYGNDELRLEMLEIADLLFEVADKVEEALTDLMVKKGFGFEETPEADSKKSDDD